MRLVRHFKVFGLFLAGTAYPALAGSVSTLPALGSNDLVDWSAVGGGVGATFAGTLPVTSNGGLAVTVTEAGTLATVQEGPTAWNGNFPIGTVLIDNQFNGPVTFTFGAPIQGFGLYIDNAFGGSFMGSIQEFEGATSMGTFSTMQSGGLMFLGVSDPGITSVIVSTTASGDNYFAFGNLSLVDTTVGVDTPPDPGSDAPEPAAIGMVLAGLAAMGLRARRRVRHYPA